MRLPSLRDTRLRNLLYTLIIILPSVLTGNMYNTTNQSEASENLLLQLSALSSSIYTGMLNSQAHLAYSLELLCTHQDFLNFDEDGMNDLLTQFNYYNATISNVYLINAYDRILFGIDDTRILSPSYRAHVDRALLGRPDSYVSFADDVPFTQFAIPVYTSQSNRAPRAALVMTYSFAPLEDELQALNHASPNIHTYLIDGDGRILVSSSNQWPETPIAIDAIKFQIDHCASTPFTLFDDLEVIGIYYTLPDTDWTLLITSSPPEAVAVSDIFAWVVGMLGAGTVSSLEMMRKYQE